MAYDTIWPLTKVEAPNLTNIKTATFIRKAISFENRWKKPFGDQQNYIWTDELHSQFVFETGFKGQLIEMYSDTEKVLYLSNISY